MKTNRVVVVKQGLWKLSMVRSEGKYQLHPDVKKSVEEGTNTTTSLLSLSPSLVFSLPFDCACLNISLLILIKVYGG